jgi:hypothetical protein
MSEKPMTLDKTRPFGTVVGDGKLFFEQDGVHFGPDEKSVERWTTPEALRNEVQIREFQKAKEARLAIRRAASERNRIIKEDDR